MKLGSNRLEGLPADRATDTFLMAAVVDAARLFGSKVTASKHLYQYESKPFRIFFFKSTTAALEMGKKLDSRFAMVVLVYI